jgi:hypothetical protein
VATGLRYERLFGFLKRINPEKVACDPNRSVATRKVVKPKSEQNSVWRDRVNARIGGGRYKLSPTQQVEANKMIRLGAKSQAEIAELFNVDRSTISRMMTEVQLKERKKAGLL